MGRGRQRIHSRRRWSLRLSSRTFSEVRRAGIGRARFRSPTCGSGASALYMTNSLGDGAVSVNPYTGTIDGGLRTMAGGQFTFQISGYLAIHTGAAPDVVVDANRSVRDMYAIIRSAPVGRSDYGSDQSWWTGVRNADHPGWADDIQCSQRIWVTASGGGRLAESGCDRRRIDEPRKRSERDHTPVDWWFAAGSERLQALPAVQDAI